MTNKEFVLSIYPCSRVAYTSENAKIFLHGVGDNTVLIANYNEVGDFDRCLSFPRGNEFAAWKAAADIINLQLMEKLES